MANKTIRIRGDGASTHYKLYLTTATENCREGPAVKAGEPIPIPSQGVVTLVGEK